MEILMFFVNFQLNHIQNCSVQVKKMRDKIFTFQMKKKYFCQMLTDHVNHTIKGMTEENSKKNRSDLYHVR